RGAGCRAGPAGGAGPQRPRGPAGEVHSRNRGRALPLRFRARRRGWDRAARSGRPPGRDVRYVVSGATSGTGNSVIRRLVEKLGRESLTCLVRPTSDTAYLRTLDLDLRVCDVTDSALLGSLLGPSTVYVDMTHPKHYHRSLEAVVTAGVERAYF